MSQVERITNTVRAKRAIAKKHGCETWADVIHQFDIGSGISKRICFEDLMDEVADQRLKIVLKKIKAMSKYNTNHDEILYAVKEINEYIKSILKQPR